MEYKLLSEIRSFSEPNSKNIDLAVTYIRTRGIALDEGLIFWAICAFPDITAVEKDPSEKYEKNQLNTSKQLH